MASSSIVSIYGDGMSVKANSELTILWTDRDVTSVHRLADVVSDQDERWDVKMREALDTLLKVYMWAQHPGVTTIQEAMSAWDAVHTAAEAEGLIDGTHLPESVHKAAIGMVNSAKDMFENVYKLLRALYVHYSTVGPESMPDEGLVAGALQLSTPGAIQTGELKRETPGIICCALRDFMDQYCRFWYQCHTTGRSDVRCPDITWRTLADDIWGLDGKYPTGIQGLNRNRLDAANPFKTKEAYAFTRLTAQFETLAQFQTYGSSDAFWDVIEAQAQADTDQAFARSLISLKFLILLK